MYLPLRRQGTGNGKMRLGVAISAVLAMTSPVLAYTGAELADSCATARGGFCLGYIVVIGQVSPAVCPPVGSIHGQVQRVAVQFLRDHPERLREPASVLVKEALRQAFPCKK
jgi:hypothetical protein